MLFPLPALLFSFFFSWMTPAPFGLGSNTFQNAFYLLGMHSAADNSPNCWWLKEISLCHLVSPELGIQDGTIAHWSLELALCVAESPFVPSQH